MAEGGYAFTSHSKTGAPDYMVEGCVGERGCQESGISDW